MNHHKSIRKWRMTFIFSLVFAIPTVIIAFVPVEWWTLTPGLTGKEVVLFLLSSIVQVSAASTLKSPKSVFSTSDVKAKWEGMHIHMYSVVRTWPMVIPKLLDYFSFSLARENCMYQ